MRINENLHHEGQILKWWWTGVLARLLKKERKNAK